VTEDLLIDNNYVLYYFLLLCYFVSIGVLKETLIFVLLLTKIGYVTK